MPDDEEVRRHAADLSGMYKVAFVAASGEVAPVVAGEVLISAAHEIALMTVRRFHEVDMEAVRRLREGHG